MCCCFSYLLANRIELDLNACWELKVLNIIIIINQNDKGQISIEFIELSN